MNAEFSLYLGIQHSAISIAPRAGCLARGIKAVRNRTARNPSAPGGDDSGPFLWAFSRFTRPAPTLSWVAHALEKRAQNHELHLRHSPTNPHRRRPAGSDRRPAPPAQGRRHRHRLGGVAGRGALAAIAAGSFDLLLMDLNYTGDTTSGREGIDLLSRCRPSISELPIVVMTGWGSVDIAVEAMRRGVRDFVQKPWDNRSARDDRCGPKSTPGRARRQQVASEQRELDEARRIQRKLLPATHAASSTGGRSRSRGSRRPALAATASTPSPSGRRASASRSPTSSARAFPAALLMSNLQASVRAFATDATQPAELCQQVNRILCGHIAEGRFISFFYCVVDNDDSHADLRQRRPLPPDPDSRRWRRRAARHWRRRARRVSRGRLRTGPGRRSAAAIASILYTDGITDVCNAARRRVRRRAPRRPGGRQPHVQRARASGPAGRCCRDVLRWPFPGRRDAHRHGGRIILSVRGAR